MSAPGKRWSAMTRKGHREKEDADYLHRARLALRVLSGAGLGEVTWIGPNWICALGDIDRDGLRFLSMKIRRDSGLRNGVRHCRSRERLRELQEEAISRALHDYAVITGNHGIGRTAEREAAASRNISDRMT